VSGSGCAELIAAADTTTTTTPASSALAQQEEAGWNVGGDERALHFSDAQPVDVFGGADWRASLPTLADRLAPGEARWLPYYGPALFQALQAPRNDELRAAVQPILTPAMALGMRRGDALLSLFMDGAGGCRGDVALVLDVPGPEAVAIAAALAPCFDPVFFFDNWPHPAGVVPSHLTLGAAVYFQPLLEQRRAARPPGAPPVFVLDRQRLLPYIDAAGDFDNRYAARLPAAGPLVAAGIQQIIYITPDDAEVVESDDLNDDLVALDQHGVSVRMLAMSDFQPETPEDPEAPAPAAPAAPQYALNLPSFQAPLPSGSSRCYFGGSRARHVCFWSWYGPRATGATAPPMPPQIAARCHYRPTLRPTFASALHGSPVHVHPGGGFAPRPAAPHAASALSALFSRAGGGRSGSRGRIHVGHSGHFG
jgi:hypothetical protein